MQAAIYWIKNTINNKVYVGSTLNVRNRWRLHQTRLKQGRHHSPKLQNSWEKHGPEAFEWAVLMRCSKTRMLEFEQLAMDGYDAVNRGYNICPTAGNMLGRKLSEATKRKLSESAKGRQFTSETRQRMSEAAQGRIISPEVRLKLSEAGKKVKFTDERRANLSKAQIGRKHSDEGRRKMSEAKIAAWESGVYDKRKGPSDWSTINNRPSERPMKGVR